MPENDITANATSDDPATARAVARAALVAEIQANTGIDEPMIANLVRTFYSRVRADALLGPIFEERITDWEAHFKLLTDFWHGVTLLSGRYHGQPMRAHVRLPIESRHFDRWLELFEATAKELCPPPAATMFIERARRIAESLETGIAVSRGEMGPARKRAAP